MAKLQAIKNGRRESQGSCCDPDASMAAMLLTKEIHKLMRNARPGAGDMLGADLYHITEEVAKGVAKGPGERSGVQQIFTRISAVCLWLAELEARLMLAQHAGHISRRHLQTLLSIISAIKRYYTAGSGGQGTLRFYHSS